MIGRETTGVKPITLSEVTEILEERAKDGELGFEQQNTLEYAKKNAKMDSKKAAELVEKVAKLEKVTPDVAAKIADIMPKNQVELNLLFAKERYTLTQEEAAEVIKTIDEYR